MLTVFCPFTRAWAVDPFFEALGRSDVPRERFVGYVDAASAELAHRVGEAAAKAGFGPVDVHLSGQDAPADNAGPRYRRPRHALMREASKELVGDGGLLLLEDDTLIPPETYGPLSETLRECDWVVGAEVGRWGQNTTPGVWKLVKRDGAFVSKVAVMPSGETTVVDATGLYCVLTTAEVYKQPDYGTWREDIGHDVDSTYSLTLAGRRLMVDWRVECVHLTQTARLTMQQAKPFSQSLLGCERITQSIHQRRP